MSDPAELIRRLREAADWTAFKPGATFRGSLQTLLREAADQLGQASAPQTWQPIAEIAVSIGDGLADWLEHRDDCVCLGDSGPHSPMCANCDCGLREALMAEAVSVASDDAVIAEVGGPEAVTKLANETRALLRRTFERWKENQLCPSPEPETQG